MHLILASSSPRRRELLGLLGYKNLRIIPTDADETLPDLPPGQAAEELALLKARGAARDCPEEAVILAADTLVCLDGDVLGKPRDAREAAQMLRRLSGARHTVYTGVALLHGAGETVFYEKTDVFFRPLTEGEIAAYVRSGEPMDKAGAYGAQGLGAVFIQRIEGDFFNVMGLPLCRLVTLLRSIGVEPPFMRE